MKFNTTFTIFGNKEISALLNAREMWEIIKSEEYKTPREYTRDYDLSIVNDCYLCDFAAQVRDDFIKTFNAETLGNSIRLCTFCPIKDWSLSSYYNSRTCCSKGSEYMKIKYAFSVADEVIKLINNRLKELGYYE